jgi:DNA-binding LacI/PurR family transcriptional regulator
MQLPTDPIRQRPTIADVARRAGVSSAAVSFAVDDRPGVSPRTRARILAAAAEPGWRPSASARALTSVRVDYADFGAAAAAALLAAIGGEEPPAYVPEPPQLVVRASTARP